MERNSSKKKKRNKGLRLHQKNYCTKIPQFLLGLVVEIYRHLSACQGCARVGLLLPPRKSTRTPRVSMYLLLSVSSSCYLKWTSGSFTTDALFSISSLSLYCQFYYSCHEGGATAPLPPEWGCSTPLCVLCGRITLERHSTRDLFCDLRRDIRHIPVL